RLLACNDLGMNLALAEHEVPKLLADGRSLCDSFSNDVKSSFNGPFHSRDLFLWIDELLCEVTRRLFTGLFPNIIRQRFQAAFQTNARLSLSFRLERQVEIFEFVFVVAGDNLRLQIIRQLPLLLNRCQYGCASPFKVRVVLPAKIDMLDLDL